MKLCFHYTFHAFFRKDHNISPVEILHPEFHYSATMFPQKKADAGGQLPSVHCRTSAFSYFYYKQLIILLIPYQLPAIPSKTDTPLYLFLHTASRCPVSLRSRSDSSAASSRSLRTFLQYRTLLPNPALSLPWSDHSNR